jgi:hypothetical protein
MRIALRTVSVGGRFDEDEQFVVFSSSMMR